MVALTTRHRTSIPSRVTGVLCTNGYVTHPFCSPSRAGLITGRQQQRFGYENNPDDDDTNPRLGLPLEELPLSQLLKPAGYVCGAIGKWHLGGASTLDPMHRGFDEFYGFLGAQSNYYNAPLLRGETPVRETEYLTDGLTREAVSFINRYATQPFFLYLAYNAVHTPFDVPPAVYMNRVGNISDWDRRVYAAMVTALDDGVGQVLQTLQDQNLLDRTLIFFLSDNGAVNAAFTRNNPLRGYKFDVWEGGIRVPFLVQWTGRLPGNVVYDDPVSSLDIVPTVAAAAGVSLPTDRVYDGLDITPYLAGEPSPQRTLFWRWFGLGADGPPGSVNTKWAVRSGPLKLAMNGTPPSTLYNLPSDIGETQDLSQTQPEDVAALQQLYDQWTIETVFPLWQGSAYFPNALVLAGDWNGFSKNDSNPPWALTRTSAPGVEGTPDSFGWWINLVHVAATGGDTTPGTHSFAVIAAHSYSEQWGGVTINIDGTTTLPFNPGSGLGPTNSITLEDGFYYSFRFLDPSQLTVMKTSAPPVSVSRSAQTPETPTSEDPIVVTIATSQVKSVQERIYLRWSTDFFITSHMVEATRSRRNYSATIPAQPAGTVVLYTIVTSTIDLSPFFTSGTIDSLTLATTAVFKVVPILAGPISTDLEVTVDDGKSAVTAGQTDTYTIVVSNLGPGDVSGATVSDIFPNIFTGVTFTATQSGGASGFTATGSGNINDTVTMPAGSIITYIASGQLSSSATGMVSNTASVSVPVGVIDTNPANNSATDTDTINLRADLKVTVTDRKTVVIPGQVNTYTIVVTNLGPSDVSGAIVNDTFPREFTGVTFTARATGGATGFTASGSGNINDTVTMPSGSKITYKATGTIDSRATGSISDTASITAPGGVTDPKLTNNNDTDTDTL